MDTPDPKLRDTLYEVMEAQLGEDALPLARRAVERLVGEGQAPQSARGLVGAAIAAELGRVMADNRPFDVARFARTLDRLPGSLEG